MSGENGWRPETSQADFLVNLNKQVQINNRRAQADIVSQVGPAIRQSAVSLDDLNDTLATFNGYYSCDFGTLNAPNQDEEFVGQTVMDDEFGGCQTFTGMRSQNEYNRVFVRNPESPETIYWSPWRISTHVMTSAVSISEEVTEVEYGGTIMTPPEIETIGEQGVFQRTSLRYNVTQSGVYNGYFYFDLVDADRDTYYNQKITVNEIRISLPQGTIQKPVSYYRYPIYNALAIPVQFHQTNTTGYVEVLIDYGNLANIDIVWKQATLTRLGNTA